MLQVVASNDSYSLQTLRLCVRKSSILPPSIQTRAGQQAVGLFGGDPPLTGEIQP